MPRFLSTAALFATCYVSIMTSLPSTQPALVQGFSTPINRIVGSGCRPLPVPSRHASSAVTRASSRIIMMSTTGSDSDGGSTSENSESKPVEIVQSSLTSSQVQSIEDSQPFLTRLQRYWQSSKQNMNPKQLSKLGISALLAYGFVSNVSGVIAVSSAWFIFSKRTGLSPLSPGQKTQFLALYAGFTLALNILRPARFALSMAISPVFERIRNFFQKQFGVGPKAATVLMVVVINLMGTCSLMACGVGLASLLSGVPIFGAR